MSEQLPQQEQIDVEYIAFFQTPWDRVKYLFPGMDKNVSMNYVKFKDFLFKNFEIKDRQKVMYHLDGFDVIVLFKSGDFEIVKNRKNPFEINFSDLWQFNLKQEEDDKTSIVRKKTDSAFGLLQEKVKKDFSNFVDSKRRFGHRKKNRGVIVR